MTVVVVAQLVVADLVGDDEALGSALALVMARDLDGALAQHAVVAEVAAHDGQPALARDLGDVDRDPIADGPLAQLAGRRRGGLVLRLLADACYSVGWFERLTQVVLELADRAVVIDGENPRVSLPLHLDAALDPEAAFGTAKFADLVVVGVHLDQLLAAALRAGALGVKARVGGEPVPALGAAHDAHGQSRRFSSRPLT